MPETTRVCIRLLSSSAPCPYLCQNPVLQTARDSLVRHSKGIGCGEVDISDLDQICQSCSKYFAPTERYYPPTPMAGLTLCPLKR